MAVVAPPGVAVEAEVGSVTWRSLSVMAPWRRYKRAPRLSWLTRLVRETPDQATTLVSAYYADVIGSPFSIR